MNTEFFLANLSLQIRNPISGIVGHSQLLSQTKLDSQQKNYVTSINQCCVQIIELVNNIVDYERIVSNRIQVNQDCFALTDLIDDITSTLGMRIKERKQKLEVSIDTDISEFIVADKEKLTQILVNLIGNAIKFSPQHTVVNLNVSKSTERLCFCIKDHGSGFDTDKKELFKPFGVSKTGLGLGLAIVKKLIETLGGDINFESKKDIGTTVSFQIKYEPFEANVSTTELKDKYILIAETDIETKTSLTDILFDLGMKPIVSNSIKETERLLERFPFKYLLVNEEFTKIKQVREKYPQLLIYLLTDEMGENGFYDRTLRKPIGRTKLIGALLKTTVPLVPPLSPVQTKQTMKILIVDNVAYHASMLCKMVANMGYTVDISDNITDSLEKMQTVKYKLIIVSQLNDHGLEVLKNNEHIPVIVIGDRDQNLDCRVDHYLHKPVVIKQLQHTIEKVIHG